MRDSHFIKLVDLVRGLIATYVNSKFSTPPWHDFFAPIVILLPDRLSIYIKFRQFSFPFIKEVKVKLDFYLCVFWQILIQLGDWLFAVYAGSAQKHIVICSAIRSPSITPAFNSLLESLVTP
jgi:hypothetical protein